MTDAHSRQVIETLSRLHGPALLQWSRGRFADPRDAEEVVADTLARAWRRFDQFDPDRGSERAWLFGIAKNAAADHYRKEKRHLRSVPVADLMAAPQSDAELDRLVENSHIMDALNGLTESHRTVVVEAYYQGKTANQIAERHGIPAGTVKSRLFYALKALRGHLEENGVVQ